MITLSLVIDAPLSRTVLHLTPSLHVVTARDHHQMNLHDSSTDSMDWPWPSPLQTDSNWSTFGDNDNILNIQFTPPSPRLSLVSAPPLSNQAHHQPLGDRLSQAQDDAWSSSRVPNDPQGVSFDEPLVQQDEEVFTFVKFSDDEEVAASGRDDLLRAPRVADGAIEKAVVDMPCSQHKSKASSRFNDLTRPCSPMEEDCLSLLDSPYSEMLVTPALGPAPNLPPVVFNPTPQINCHGVPELAEVTSAGPASLAAPKSGPQPHAPAIGPFFEGNPPASPTLSDLSTTGSSLTNLPLPIPARRVVPFQRSRRAAAFTGTRKGITPDTLTPINAPTRQRKYAGPSLTAKKALPKAFGKRRGESQESSEEEEGRAAKNAKVEPADVELIETKRRQNTEAARRSRRRKLEYQQTLEVRLAEALLEKDNWQMRAEVAESVLEHHGLAVPFTPNACYS